MTDQQAKNRRIHELMGRTICVCVTECDCEDFEKGLVSNECPEHNDNPYPHPDCFEHADVDLPDYYNDPIVAREALAFAVEQKGAEVVGDALAAQITLNGELYRSFAKDLMNITDPLDVVNATASAACITAALAPASVLCDAVLAVFSSDLAVMDKEK